MVLKSAFHMMVPMKEAAKETLENMLKEEGLAE